MFSPDPLPDVSGSPAAGTAATLPVVLTIAGYDPSAGAGVLADVKTLAANGVYGMACVTAWTVQSTAGVRRMAPLDPELVVETLECLAADVRFAAIKVGMLGNGGVAAAVLGWLGRDRSDAVVLDPVLRSSSGADLLDNAGLALVREQWLGRVDWITPNREELAALIGEPVPKTPGEIEAAAGALQGRAARLGNPNLRIVVTGGDEERPDDLLLTAAGFRWYRGERVETRSTHGTGCAFSSALAARLALGEGNESAVESAKEYVSGGLRAAVPVGQGKGPLNHFWRGVL